MIPFPGLTENLSPRWRKSSGLLRPNPQLELLTSLALKRHLGCGVCLFLEKDGFGITSAAGLSAGAVFDLFSDPRYGALPAPENTKREYHFTFLQERNQHSTFEKLMWIQIIFLVYSLLYNITVLHNKKKKIVSFPTKPIRRCYWVQDPANKPVVTSIAPMIHSEAL